jgi:hypothetical protein
MAPAPIGRFQMLFLAKGHVSGFRTMSAGEVEAEGEFARTVEGPESFG